MKATKEPSPEPTRSELEILQVLWQFGPNTVRFVNDQLNAEKREVQYASTLKLMQIMVEKGLLLRDESQVRHIYSAAGEEQKTKRFLLNRFVDSLFNGSVSSLMMHLLDGEAHFYSVASMIKQMSDDGGGLVFPEMIVVWHIA